MRTRVAVVYPLVISPQDGASRRTLLAIEALIELGYDVTVLTVKEARKFIGDSRIIELDSYKIEYNRSLLREMMVESSLLRRYFMKIFKAILRERFDIVEIHGVMRAAPQIAGLLAAKIAGATIIYNYHDLLPEEGTLIRGVSYNSLLYRLLLMFEKFIFRLSSMIIVVSDTMRDLLLRRYGKRFRQRISVVYPYVNVGELPKRDANKYSLRKYGIPEGKPTIIYVGRLDQVIRGLENLVTAFGRLVGERKIDAYLLLVGKGMIKEELKRMTIEQGIKNRVIFTGNVAHEEAMRLLNEADVAVISYPELIGTHVALPTKIVEYMAAGKIIVSSRLAQIKRILKRDAVYFDPQNIDSFADALEKALARIDKAEKVRQVMQKKAKLFDKKTVKEHAMELYKMVLQPK